MNIYDLLNRIIENKKYSLSSNLFVETDKDKLSEEDKLIFDLLKNVDLLEIESMMIKLNFILCLYLQMVLEPFQ